MKKRKLLWASLKEQEPGGNGVSTRKTDGTFQKGDEKEKGFAASTAEATGMSKQAINQYVSIRWLDNSNLPGHPQQLGCSQHASILFGQTTRFEFVRKFVFDNGDL